MHEYFEFLKKDFSFSFIALIVCAIVSLIAFILFGNTNDDVAVSDETVVSESINHVD